MEKRTVGIVISVKKQWWFKVNTKAVRSGPLDGAIFPHIVTVKYAVGGNEIIKRKWLGAFVPPPFENSKIIVVYKEDKPTKFRLEI